MTRFAFERMGLERLEVRCARDNEPAVRVAEQAGFTREGILRGGARGPEGRFDVLVLGQLHTDRA